MRHPAPYVLHPADQTRKTTAPPEPAPNPSRDRLHPPPPPNLPKRTTAAKPQPLKAERSHGTPSGRTPPGPTGESSPDHPDPTRPNTTHIATWASRKQTANGHLIGFSHSKLTSFSQSLIEYENQRRIWTIDSTISAICAVKACYPSGTVTARPLRLARLAVCQV